MEEIVKGIYCEKVLELSAPRSIYGALFHPTMVHPLRPGLLSAIEARCSSFSIGDMLPVFSVETRNALNDNFIYLSRFDVGHMLAVSTSLYRLAELGMCAIQHRIEQSDWSVTTKFWISGAVSVLPLAVVFLAGGPYVEMLIVSLVKTAASYALRPIRGNLVKELDLIAKTRDFTVKGFLAQNAMIAIRNLTLTAIMGSFIVAGAFPPAKDLVGRLHARSNTPTLYDCMRLQDELQITVMVGTFTSSLTHLIDGCSWMLGKIATDGVFILLSQLGVVKDLRDPLNSIFSRGRSAGARRQLRLISASERNIAAPARERTARRQPFQAEMATQIAFPVQPDVPVIEYTEHTGVRKVKQKTRPDRKDAVVEEAGNMIQVRPVSHINIPNYSRQLIALYGQGVQGLRNPWGVVTYGVHGKEKETITSYLTSLSSGHVGSTGAHAAMKYLGKHKQTGKTLYEIRPAKREERLLGTLIEGEEEVYNVLKSVFGYERALELVEQMKCAKEDNICLIDFRTMVHHHQIRNYVA